MKKILGLLGLGWAGMIFYNRFTTPTIEGTTAYEAGKRLGQNMAVVFACVLVFVCLRLLFYDSAADERSSRGRNGRQGSFRNSRVSPIWAVIVIAMLIGLGWYELQRTSRSTGLTNGRPEGAQPAVAAEEARPAPGQVIFPRAVPAHAEAPMAESPADDIRRRLAVKPPAMPLEGKNPAAIPGGFLELDPAAAAAKFPGRELLAGRFPGGKPELPQNCVPVGNETRLVPGTPVKYYFVRWTDGTVLDAPNGGGQVVIREAGLPFKKSVDRDALAISAETLKSLNEPNAAGKYAAAAKEARKATSHRFIHKYPAFVPVPQVAVRVTAETPLKEGVIVGLCLGRRWEEVEVLALNDDDSVHVRWNRRRTGFEEDVDRSDLIIAKKVLRTLNPRPGAAAAKGADEDAKTGGGL